MPTPREEQHAKMVAAGIESTSRLLGLKTSQPTYEGTPVLTIDKAEQAKRVAEEWFIDKIGFQESELPTMYAPGHEGPMWVLSLEGGPEDWTIMLSHDDTVKWPDGVFVEPVASWCLGLYPA